MFRVQGLIRVLGFRVQGLGRNPLTLSFPPRFDRKFMSVRMDLTSLEEAAIEHQLDRRTLTTMMLG